MYNAYGVFPIGGNDTCSNSSHTDQTDTGWTNVETCTNSLSPPQCCYQFQKQPIASLVSLYCADDTTQDFATQCNALNDVLYVAGCHPSVLASDSLGMRSGIWRSKFDCVRFASMLLAMRQYNENLKESHAGHLSILCLNHVNH